MKIAAIDIGSNAVRLIISRILSDGHLKRIEFIRVPLRLGDDVFHSKVLSVEKAELLKKTIQSFKLLMEVHQVHDFRACGTSALRDALNGKEVVDRIHKETGISIEIISGMEESRIILDSVMRFFPEHGNFINIDVGGGSTEMTIIHDHQPVISASFNVGTVRQIYGSVSGQDMHDMLDWVKTNINGLKSIVAVGTGGNINKAFKMLSLEDKSSLSYDKLKTLYNQMKEMTLKDRILKLDLNPDRADVIVHALKIHLSIMKEAGIRKIFAPNAGLKDGLIEELASRHMKEVFVPSVESESEA